MKRILFFLLFLSMLPLAVSASVLIDGFYYDLDANTKTAKVVFHYKYHYSGDVVIPSSVTYDGVEYSVTTIGDAFRGSTDLTSLTIPASVTSIEAGIFGSCTSLTSLIIEEGNPVYDSRENCNAVIETASNTLISGCTGTIVPNSVTSIGGKAFNGCSGLTSVNIPNSVTSIGEEAFYGCSNLKKVILNNNAIVSEDNHFGSPTPITRYFGTQVEEYVLGEDVTSIGYDAFYNCSSLISVQMSNSVISIGESAFQGCHNLTSVKMSDNLTSIGQFAFQECYNLASITIPRGVTDIEWVFGGCNGFTKVVINSNAIMSKNYNAGSSLSRYFGYQVKEYVLGEEVTAIGNNAFYGCGGLTSIIIPMNVTSIGDDAFHNCTSLTSVNIPKNVTSIGENAFHSCSGLTTIQVESGNTVYDSRENCNAIIKTADNTLLFGCQNTVIPNSVETIGENAFYSCTGLTSISIPDGVTTIGYSSFCGCMALTSVSIPNSVKSIGNHAFYNCYGLTDISIPNGVTTVGDYAFFGCSSLMSITIPSSVTSIGSRVLNNCFVLTTIQVDNGNTVYDSREDCNAIIETASNTLLEGCQNTVIPNSVTGIGECAFWGCSGLTAINIPNSVTNIGSSAFAGCSELTSVTIPNSVTSIRSYTFSNCLKLATVIIGNGVTNIEEGAFYGCSHMTDMYCYAEKVPELGDEVFEFWINSATLHVPEAYLEAYNTTEQWMDFGIIVALTDDDPTPTGIKGIKDDVMTGESYYSIDGKHIITPQRGLNIIRMSDGTTKKIVIK